MEEFKAHFPLRDRLQEKQDELLKTLNAQLKLSKEIKDICTKMKLYEMTAFYRDLEKKFKDLLKLIDVKTSE
tara:strand:- start:363415 stop:363630 length:216 start_codon:yes stop_codon:yes gene_type:complete